MSFGHYLRRAREGREMTLTDLARRVGISIAYLSRIERERENPPPELLVVQPFRAFTPKPNRKRIWSRKAKSSTAPRFHRMTRHLRRRCRQPAANGLAARGRPKKSLRCSAIRPSASASPNSRT